MYWYSLVPRPPPFLPSVCFHNNIRKQKTGKKILPCTMWMETEGKNRGGLGMRLYWCVVTLSVWMLITLSLNSIMYTTHMDPFFSFTPSCRWLAGLVAWLYIILLPFVACIPALVSVTDILLKIIQFPLQCGKNIRDGNDFNEGVKAAETTSTS